MLDASDEVLLLMRRHRYHGWTMPRLEPSGWLKRPLINDRAKFSAPLIGSTFAVFRMGQMTSL
jgi:hypothetical protein